jgi:integrase
LRRRFKKARDAAGLRSLRFHDLRHTFGSVAIRTADPRELQEWMGHSDFSTTQIYMHYKPRADAARRLSAAFGPIDERDGVRAEVTATAATLRQGTGVAGDG